MNFDKREQSLDRGYVPDASCVCNVCGCSNMDECVENTHRCCINFNYNQHEEQREKLR